MDVMPNRTAPVIYLIFPDYFQLSIWHIACLTLPPILSASTIFFSSNKKAATQFCHEVLLRLQNLLRGHAIWLHGYVHYDNMCSKDHWIQLIVETQKVRGGISACQKQNKALLLIVYLAVRGEATSFIPPPAQTLQMLQLTLDLHRDPRDFTMLKGMGETRTTRLQIPVDLEQKASLGLHAAFWELLSLRWEENTRSLVHWN